MRGWLKKVRKVRQLRIPENINASSRAFYECIAKGDPLASSCRLSRARQIIRIKRSATTPSTIMLGAKHNPDLFLMLRYRKVSCWRSTATKYHFTAQNRFTTTQQYAFRIPSRDWQFIKFAFVAGGIKKDICAVGNTRGQIQ